LTKIRVEVPIVFKILYAEKSSALVSQCQKIERKVDQTVSIEVPSEIAGLLQHLSWNGTLGLWVAIQAEVAVEDARSLKSEKSSRKGFLAKINF
jgi:hypothetical protein